MIYSVKFTKQFEKDLKQAVKRGLNLDKLFAVIEKLKTTNRLNLKIEFICL